MLLTVTPLADVGPPSPAPPPTAPKPSKDNARLQRLLRKGAKRGGVQASPTMPPKSFRSTLSPVSEADLESSEPTAPKKLIPPPLNLPPRFQIKAVTHRVPSPYPKHRGFTFTVVEQQSLNQFLSSPQPRQTPSPRPPDANILDVQSQDHDMHPPCSPGGKEPPYCSQGSATPKTSTPTLSAMSHAPISNIRTTTVLSLPVTPQKSSGHLSPKIEETRNEGQSNKDIMITENGYQIQKSGHTGSAMTASCLSNDVAAELPTIVLTDQKGDTYKPGGCCSISPVVTPTTQTTLSPSPEDTNKKGPLCSGDVDIPHQMSTHDTGHKDTIQTPALRDTDVHSGSCTLPPGTTSISPSSELTALPKGQCTSIMGKHKVPGTEVLQPTIKAAVPEEMNLLKNPERARPPRRKPGGGWARLVKHLVVEPDEPTFPEQQKPGDKKEKAGENVGSATEVPQQSRSSRANKMWDALLYHMSTPSKVQDKPGSEAPPALPFLRSRLPLLLHRPRFDARKLKEAVSRPLRRVNAFFHRRTGDKPISTFNRTASGWSIRAEDAQQGDDVDKMEQKVKV
ncbi:proline-rich protein 33 isoform 1-T2 [Discoglossus pictus]